MKTEKPIGSATRIDRIAPREDGEMLPLQAADRWWLLACGVLVLTPWVALVWMLVEWTT